MTIIIALAHEEGVTIGSDRLWVAGGDALKCDEPKWTINEGGLSVGLSGSPYLAEEIGEAGANRKNPSVLCSILRDRLREVEHWPGEVLSGGRPPAWDLNLILTDGADVWEVGASLFPMSYPREQPVAVGSGYQYALGAMLECKPLLPKEIVWAGLCAAINYDTCCGGEPWVETLKRKS